jgi:hypothetical protein
VVFAQTASKSTGSIQSEVTVAIVGTFSMALDE